MRFIKLEPKAIDYSEISQEATIKLEARRLERIRNKRRLSSQEECDELIRGATGRRIAEILESAISLTLRKQRIEWEEKVDAENGLMDHNPALHRGGGTRDNTRPSLEDYNARGVRGGPHPYGGRWNSSLGLYMV